MTAVALSRPGRFRPARAVRLEIRHSPVVWTLPAVALIFYYDTYRTAIGQPPTWANYAAMITGHMLIYVCVVGAGLGAWAGTRDGRRKTGDLLATTARAPWARQLTVLAATAFWVVLAFLAETAVIYVQAARVSTWGGPPLWPVAAALVVVTTHSPFGEAERTAGRWLPCLRLGTVLALTGVAIGLLQLGAVGAALNDGVLTLARNVIGLTGIGLLTSIATGGLLAWVVPLGYVGFAQYALAEAWQTPWIWPARPPSDRGAWLCAALAFAVGLLAVTIRGARTRLADDA